MVVASEILSASSQMETQAAFARGGGARVDHRHGLGEDSSSQDDEGEVQVGREGGDIFERRRRSGAEAQDPLVAGDADRVGEAAVGGRAHADRAQGLRTLKPAETSLGL